MAAAVRFLFLSLITLSMYTYNAFSLSEGEILLKLKKSFTNPNALNNWAPGTSPCGPRWVGIICFDGVITGLHLYGLGLSGSIDIEALQQLQNLRTMSFVNNSFSGPIPAFNRLGAIKSLFLSENQFSGEISSDFFTPLSSLKKVWLSKNNFTGKIPESVMQLPHLIELHLEGNGFTGQIPPLKYPKMVTSFDISHNKLVGEIPSILSTFSAKSFGGNSELCGKPLERDCSAMLSPPSPLKTTAIQEKSSSGDGGTLAIGIVVVAVIGLLAVLSIFAGRKRNKDDDFSILGSEHRHDEVIVPVSMEERSNRPSSASQSSRKSAGEGGGSTRKGSNHSRNSLNTDLIMVNGEKGSFGLQDLMKAAAEVLGNGGLGSAYKATMSNGLSVVVKRMRELNALSKEGFEAEIRRFGRIRHRNILTPLAYHYRKEEKLLVSEYMPKGSLLYVLHGDRGICHAELNWPTRLKILKGVVSGLRYLHLEYANYNLPHGNLKSSNILLNENYESVLSDYALDPLTNQTHAAQAMFAYKSPEYVQFQQVSPKSDVYCLGIIILELITGKFPSQYLSNGKGGTDVVQWVMQARAEQREQELIDPEIASNGNTTSMVQLLQIGAACAQNDPKQWLDMAEAIRMVEQVQV